ncbi:MAG: hypothetical protein HZC11_07680 [Nitrospirae bacterium]|nr:hypothetical protein [Nitrospirota bacterium]
MKKESEEVSEDNKQVSKLKSFFGIGLDKLRHGLVRCPFCREEFHGLKELGLHIKDVHCR